MAGKNFHVMDEAVFFYINLGTAASPTWTIIKQAEDIKCDISKAEIELKGGVAGFKTYRGGDFDLPLTFMYSRSADDVADPVYDELYKESFVGRKPIQLALTVGLIATAKSGFHCPFEVIKHGFKKERDGQQVYELECKPTDMCESDALVLPELIVPSGA